MKNFWKMKIIWLLMIMLFSFFWNTFAYKELLIENRWWKPIRVIKVILDWQDFVITSVAPDWWDTLENLIKKVWWDSGINGTFFCPADYSYCGGVTHSNYERIYLWDEIEQLIVILGQIHQLELSLVLIRNETHWWSKII